MILSAVRRGGSTCNWSPGDGQLSLEPNPREICTGVIFNTNFPSLRILWKLLESVTHSWVSGTSTFNTDWCYYIDVVSVIQQEKWLYARSDIGSGVYVRARASTPRRCQISQNFPCLYADIYVLCTTTDHMVILAAGIYLVITWNVGCSSNLLYVKFLIRQRWRHFFHRSSYADTSDLS
jgi:hypothetical protein